MNVFHHGSTSWPCIHLVPSLAGPYKVNITQDALRMRCRRLCEKKTSGRINIDQETVDSYREGGQAREMLEIALLECLARHGTKREVYKRVKA